MPIASDNLSLVRTPTGRIGCACTVDSVIIVVEPARARFTWVRGRMWIDGADVSESEFSEKLAAAKLRKRIEAVTAAAAATKETLSRQAEEIWRRARSRVRR
jgi:hypothetical protein